jgi:GH35 family endo-1,4-beta-xylanase
MRPLALVVVSAVFAGACIKQSVSTTGGLPTVAPSSKPEPAAPPPVANGKYGEVPSTPVVGGPGVDLLRQLTLQGAPTQVVLSFVPVTGQPFPEALRAEVKEASPNPWDLQVLVKNSQTIQRGDTLLATFYFRTEASRQESGEGQTELVFELGRPPWTKSVSFPVTAARDWRKIQVPFESAMTYPAGEAKLNFRLGFAPQTVELGGITVESFGAALPVSALPVTRAGYRGMEPDAKWRKNAAERIENIRKGDITVIVTDVTGRKMVGAEVRIHQVGHAFGFGTAVSPPLLTGPVAEQYTKVLTELFNVATLENSLKWVALAGDWGQSYTLEAAQGGIAWLRAHGIGVRGHVAVWPGWANLPRALRTHEKDPAYLRNAVDERIRNVMTAVKGQVIHWDVVNEPFDNHDLIDILGEKSLIDWFKLARATDPTAKLFINDYAILSGGGGETAHRAHYEKTIKLLIDGKAPLDAIGMEGHFGNSLTAPEDMLAILDRFGKLGKPIWVTEYDNEVTDPEVAAKFTRDFYTVMFSHPSVDGVVMWGFWDGAHWKNSAPLYRRDWTLKPSGEAFRELVQKTWRTDVAGKTDGDGRFGTRGFYGEYEVYVSFAGRQKTIKVPHKPALTGVISAKRKGMTKADERKGISTEIKVSLD